MNPKIKPAGITPADETCDLTTPYHDLVTVAAEILVRLNATTKAQDKAA